MLKILGASIELVVIKLGQSFFNCQVYSQPQTQLCPVYAFSVHHPGNQRLN
jgi:hypothetical protein